MKQNTIMMFPLFCFFRKRNGFPITLLHCDKKTNTIRQKNGASIRQIHSLTKDDILQEASAYFGTNEQHILAYKDGPKVPNDFSLLVHLKGNKIFFPSRATAGQCIYLINSRDIKGMEK